MQRRQGNFNWLPFAGCPQRPSCVCVSWLVRVRGAWFHDLGAYSSSSQHIFYLHSALVSRPFNCKGLSAVADYIHVCRCGFGFTYIFHGLWISAVISCACVSKDTFNPQALSFTAYLGSSAYKASLLFSLLQHSTCAAWVGMLSSHDRSAFYAAWISSLSGVCHLHSPLATWGFSKWVTSCLFV